MCQNDTAWTGDVWAEGVVFSETTPIFFGKSQTSICAKRGKDAIARDDQVGTHLQKLGSFDVG